MKIIFKARYGLMMMAFGFLGATAIAKNQDVFDALPIVAQAAICIGFCAVGILLVWKDRSQS